jgi:hypothetical protein
VRRLTVVLAVALAACGGGGDRLTALVDSDGGWDTATHASETLASIGEILLSGCEGDRCQASAWAQAAAVRVLRCTRPGLFEARGSARTLVAAVQRGARPLELPQIPRC